MNNIYPIRKQDKSLIKVLDYSDNRFSNKINVTLSIDYDMAQTLLGALSPFVASLQKIQDSRTESQKVTDWVKAMHEEQSRIEEEERQARKQRYKMAIYRAIKEVYKNRIDYKAFIAMTNNPEYPAHTLFYMFNFQQGRRIRFNTYHRIKCRCMLYDIHRQGQTKKQVGATFGLSPQGAHVCLKRFCETPEGIMVLKRLTSSPKEKTQRGQRSRSE